MNILYKLLSGSDVPLFKELLAVFGEAFEEPQTYQDAIPSDAYLTSLLEKNHFIALLALEGQYIIKNVVLIGAGLVIGSTLTPLQMVGPCWQLD